MLWSFTEKLSWLLLWLYKYWERGFIRPKWVIAIKSVNLVAAEKYAYKTEDLLDISETAFLQDKVATLSSM